LSYPPLEDLVSLAREGKTDELLLGLAKRLDARERIAYERAVSAFNFLTESPKARMGEAELKAATETGPYPQDSEEFVGALIKLCEVRNGDHYRAQFLSRRAEGAEHRQPSYTAHADSDIC